jgi:hypothetical protein
MAYYSSESNALYSSLRVNQPAGFFPAESSALYSSLRVNQPAGFLSPEVDTIFSRLRLRDRIYFSLNEDIEPQIPQPLSISLTGYGHSAASISGGTVLAPGSLQLTPEYFTRSGGDLTTNSSYPLNRAVALADPARWQRSRSASVNELAVLGGFRYRSSTGGGFTLAGTEYFEHFDARLPLHPPRHPCTLQFRAASSAGAVSVTLRLTPSSFIAEAQVQRGSTVITTRNSISGLSQLRILRGGGQCMVMLDDTVLMPSTESPFGPMRFTITGSTEPYRIIPVDQTLNDLTLHSLMLVEGRIQPGRAQQAFSFRSTLPPAEGRSDIIICGPWGLANLADYVYSQRLVPAPYVGTNVRGR